MWRNDLEYLFPVKSLTPKRDRQWLAQLFELTRSQYSSYRYLEVGSYLGGTLTPALLDERCAEILSIDARPDIQSDSRSANYDYSKIQTANMLETLRAHGLPNMEKLSTFDGSAKDCDFKNVRYELAFIDAEHTDEAVFTDFLALQNHLTPSSICAFHDANLITYGLENIRSLLNHQKREHAFIVFRSSWVAAIFFDRKVEDLPRLFLDNAADWNEFKNKSRDDLLLSAVKNRCAMNFVLKPPPVLPP